MKNKKTLNSYYIKKMCFFLFFFSSFAFANPVTNLEKKLEYISSLKANFIQTSDDSDGQSSTKGLFLLKKPGKFYWKTEKNVHQTIISDGKTLWIYDQDLEQVLIKTLKSNVGVGPVLLLNGNINSLEKNYNVKQSDNTYTLIPKEQTLYRRIQIIFDNKGLLLHMRFEDNTGIWTNFNFRNVQVNQPLSNKIFIFVPPPHIDIIRE